MTKEHGTLNKDEWDELDKELKEKTKKTSSLPVQYLDVVDAVTPRLERQRVREGYSKLDARAMRRYKVLFDAVLTEIRKDVEQREWDVPVLHTLYRTHHHAKYIRDKVKSALPLWLFILSPFIRWAIQKLVNHLLDWILENYLNRAVVMTDASYQDKAGYEFLSHLRIWESQSTTALVTDFK